MFYGCLSPGTYWQRIMVKISSSVGTEADFTPALYLLNSMKGNERMDRKKAQRTKVDLSPGQRVILRHWRSDCSPACSEWITVLAETASYERFIYKINGNIDTYAEIWELSLTPGDPI